MSNFKETVTTLYNMTVQWKPRTKSMLHMTDCTGTKAQASFPGRVEDKLHWCSPMVLCKL